MFQIFFGIVAGCAMRVAIAFILSRTAPSMPQNKMYRFVLSFVLCVPLNVIINYVNVWTLGYHKMGWTATFIFALLFATWLTFLPPEPHNSSTP